MSGDALPGGPFERQWEVFRERQAARRPEDGPEIAWRPDPHAAAQTNLARHMRSLGFTDYAGFHRFTARDRGVFWEGVVDRLDVPFASSPERTLDLSRGPEHPVWLPGARMNAAALCLRGDPSRTAVIAAAEGDPALRQVSLGALDELSGRVAAGLAALGMVPGDRVALYMPMTVECVAAYLGIVRAGLAAVSVADSFSAEELARRLRLSEAKAVVTVDRFERGGKVHDLYAKVREAGSGRAVVVPSGAGASVLRPGDLDWRAFTAGAALRGARPEDPYAVTNVLFSSGTTGDPKAIPWTHLTPLKCAMDGHFHQDIRPGDVVAWPTNIGWMMGPWLIYAALANGASVALYEGLPSGEGFARFVAAAGVTVLGTVPSLVKAWRASGALEAVDWSRIRVYSSTGEASNPEDYLWLMSRSGYRAPVIEYCGGTEIGGGHLTGTLLQPASPATFTTPALGLDIAVLGEDGREVAVGGMGELFVVPPSIGLSQSLLNKDHHAVYYEGCPPASGGGVLRRHGDQVMRLGGGFWKAQGRADDTMNLGGIKVSSVELEEAVNTHPAVGESAAVAHIRGGEGVDHLVLFVVLKVPVPLEGLRQELQAVISRRLNPLFRIHAVVPVDRLPRTASNKIMRRELRAAYRDGGI